MAENTNDHRDQAGGERAINSAPPVPGAASPTPNQEQPISPAPAVPIAGAQPAGAGPQERAIKPAPTLPGSGGQEQRLAGPGALPSAPIPGGSLGEQPLAGAPKVPMSGSQETRLAGPSAVPFGPTVTPQQPIMGAPQIPMPQAPMPGAGGVQEVPMGRGPLPGAGGVQEFPMAQGATPAAGGPAPMVPQAGVAQPAYGQPQGYPGVPVQPGAPGQMAPGVPVVGMAPTGMQAGAPIMHTGMVPGGVQEGPVAPVAVPNPAWGQPPSNPPPIPPPNQPLAPAPQSGPIPVVPAQPQSGYAGNVVSTSGSGESFPQGQRTQTAKALRHRSRQQSKHLALMFLFGSALFLIGVFIVVFIWAMVSG